ncbi:putative ABC transporter permease subunit YbbP [Sodalis sp.]|uniref:putative ABC transporter permease subunit YbbP n=1 Tax=Sodalis sp. (in: enterobacteria) TaxID=1898979 RepID=UPI00387314CD
MIARWFWREWRTPSMLIVWLALTLSVACVLALGNLSDRMEKGLNQQSREFLAADRVLRAARPVDERWLSQTKADGLTLSRQLTFMTMTFAGDAAQLARVKVADGNYPLYGELITRPANQRPAAGEALVAPRLLALLGLKTGDSLEVGDATLRVAGEVLREPDSGFNPFQTAPGIIINTADVEKTGAVQPGGRVTWRYLFAGEPEELQRFENWLTPQLKADQRWNGPEESSGALNRSIERSQFSALLTLLLSVAAVAVAMGHYCRSRAELVAVLKTLGAGRLSLIKLIIGQWLALLAFSAVCGALAGLAFEAVLIKLLAPVLPATLPAAGVWPWLWSMGSLVVISLLVGVRPYRQLLATRPLRVLRRDVLSTVWPLRYYLPAVLALLLGLLLWLVGRSPLLWSVVAGMVVLALLLAVVGWGALLLLRRLTLRRLTLRLAVNRLLRQPWVTQSQLAAFSLSFMLLGLLLVMRGDLLQRWQQQLPTGSPNYFLLNMTDEQVDTVNRFLRQRGVTPGVFYPVVRARLTAITDRSATDIIKPDDPGGPTVNRELNLTWLRALPDHNPLLAGHWPPRAGEVSMEQGVAKDLGGGIGDRLTFTGDTQSFSATVSSLRQVDWESLLPNFFFIFPPGGMEGQPQTWLTSFRYDGNEQLVTALTRQFPTLSLLDIGAMLRQVGQVLQQISRALEIMVILVLMCGWLLLMAQVQVGMRQRQQELVVYRILGASRKLLRWTLWNEFALLGLVAGAVTAIGAEAALMLLQRRVFDFPARPDPYLWWALPLGGMLLLSLLGTVLGARLVQRKGRLGQDWT